MKRRKTLLWMGALLAALLVLSLAAGLCLCQNINHYIRKNEKGVMKPLMLNLLRVICLLVLPLLVVAAVMECYVTPQVMQLFM